MPLHSDKSQVNSVNVPISTFCQHKRDSKLKLEEAVKAREMFCSRNDKRWMLKINYNWMKSSDPIHEERRHMRYVTSRLPRQEGVWKGENIGIRTRSREKIDGLEWKKAKRGTQFSNGVTWKFPKANRYYIFLFSSRPVFIS